MERSLDNNNFIALITEGNAKNNRGVGTGTWLTIGIFSLIMICIVLVTIAIIVVAKRNGDDEEDDDRPLYAFPPSVASSSQDVPDSEFTVQSGPIGSFPNPLDEFKKYRHPDWVGFIEHPFQPQNYPVSTMHVLRLKSGPLIGIIFTDSSPITEKYGIDRTLYFMKEIYRATKDKANTFFRLTSGPCLVYYLRDSKSLGEAEMNYSPRSSWLGTRHDPGMQTHLHEFGHNIFHFVSRDTGRNVNGVDDMKDWVDNIAKNTDVWRKNRIYDWCMEKFFYECEPTRPGEAWAGAVSGFFCKRQRDLMKTYDSFNFNILSKYFYERDITTSCPK